MILSNASNLLDSMSDSIPQPCGSCANKCAWEYLAKKLANALYQVDDPALADEALAEYERFRFLETYPK